MKKKPPAFHESLALSGVEQGRANQEAEMPRMGYDATVIQAEVKNCFVTLVDIIMLKLLIVWFLFTDLVFEPHERASRGSVPLSSGSRLP